MPLHRGHSPAVVGQNIGEMVRRFKDTGKIGTSHPASKARAVKQAVAIALRKAGKSKRKSGR